MVALEVSVNGADFTSNAVQYEYQASSQVTSVSPSSGPLQGGTVVMVSGTDFVFSGSLACRFGVMDVAAAFVNRTLVRCIAPAQGEGAVAVEVTMSTILRNGWLYAWAFTYHSSFDHVHWCYLVLFTDFFWTLHNVWIIRRTNSIKDANAKILRHEESEKKADVASANDSDDGSLDRWPTPTLMTKGVAQKPRERSLLSRANDKVVGF